MALTPLKRTSTRVVTTKTPKDKIPFAQNDLLLSTRKTKDGQKDLFVISTALFESTQLNLAEYAAMIAVDRDENKIFFIVLPFASEYAEVFKARKGEKFKNKSEEFQHKDTIQFFEELDIVTKEREIGYAFGFALTPAPEKVTELEGAIQVFEITSAPLVGRAAKKSKVEGSTETEIEESISEESAIEVEAAPVAEVVAETQDDWDE